MKVMAIAVFGCVTSGIAATDAASAQVVGERIRVTLPAGRIVGVLAETGPDELVLALPAGGFRTVAHDEIQRLERSLGQRRRTMLWAKYGALAGTVSGGGLGLSFALDGCFSLGEADDDCSGEGLAVASFALISGLVGAGGGAVLGALQSDERWETIDDRNSPGMASRLGFDVYAGPWGRKRFFVGGQLRF